MVDFGLYRAFDSRFIHFGLAALFLKLALYLIQSQTSIIMNSISPSTVVIQNGNSSATINLFGATLTSWIVEGDEMLFVSKKSLFDGKKAIRGGVPVIFPQFGPWKNGPQHGFARISRWAIRNEKNIGSESVTLLLEDTDSTRQLWNHRFRFEYTITLVSEKQLKMDVIITNTGLDSFPFTFLLHTYFAVPDVLLCKINRLKGCTYIDKVKEGEYFEEDREDITISEFTDRIYVNTPIIQKVKHVSGKREVIIEKFNLPDTVVWNPWVDNAISMSDFDDDEWKFMLCVEAGVVHTPVILEPQKSFVAAQILSVN